MINLLYKTLHRYRNYVYISIYHVHTNENMGGTVQTESDY